VAASPPQNPGATVRTLLTSYEKRQLSQLRRGGAVAKALNAALRRHLHRDPQSLTRRELAELIDEIAEHAPVQANRSLAYMKAFFSWAVGRGYLEVNPAATVSPPAREVARERSPGLLELVRIWRACERMGYPFGSAIQLLILTAMRREEVGAMSIDELELDRDALPAVWVLPADRSKNSRAIRVPLSPLATAMLAKALASRPPGSQPVFTTTGQRSISGWSKAKARLDGLIAADGAPQLAPWRLHDLRRSFATLACDELQIDPAVADRCLNHVGSSTRSTIARVYGRGEMFAQRDAALRAWGALIEEALARSGLAKPE
jgi:integrase